MVVAVVLVGGGGVRRAERVCLSLLAGTTPACSFLLVRSVALLIIILAILLSECSSSSPSFCSRRTRAPAETLQAAWADLTHFFILFILLVGAFSALGHIFYGTSIEELHDFGGAVVTMLLALFGRYELAEDLGSLHGVSGLVFFFLCVRALRSCLGKGVFLLWYHVAGVGVGGTGRGVWVGASCGGVLPLLVVVVVW